MATLNITINSEPAAEGARRISKAVRGIGHAAMFANENLALLETTTLTAVNRLATINSATRMAFDSLVQGSRDFNTTMATQRGMMQQTTKGISSDVARMSRSVEYSSNNMVTRLNALGVSARGNLGQLSETSKNANRELGKFPRTFVQVERSAATALGSITKLLGSLALGVFLVGELVMIFYALGKAWSSFSDSMTKGVTIFNQIAYQFEIFKTQLMDILKAVAEQYAAGILEAFQKMNVWIANNKEEIVAFITNSVEKIRNFFSAIKSVYNFVSAHPLVEEMGILGYAMFGKSKLGGLIGMIYLASKAVDLVKNLAAGAGAVVGGAFSAFDVKGMEDLKKKLRVTLELQPKYNLGETTLEENIELATLIEEDLQKKLDALGPVPVVVPLKPKTPVAELLKMDPFVASAVNLMEEYNERAHKNAVKALEEYTKKAEPLREAINKTQQDIFNWKDMIKQRDEQVRQSLRPDIDAKIYKEIYKEIFDTTGEMLDEYYAIKKRDIEKRSNYVTAMLSGVIGKPMGAWLRAEAFKKYELDQAKWKAEDKLLIDSYKKTGIMSNQLYSDMVDDENRLHELRKENADTMVKYAAEAARHIITLLDLQIEKQQTAVRLYEKVRKEIPAPSQEWGPSEIQARLASAKAEYDRDVELAMTEGRPDLVALAAMAKKSKEFEILNHNAIVYVESLKKMLDVERQTIMNPAGLEHLEKQKSALESMGIYIESYYEKIAEGIKKQMSPGVPAGGLSFYEGLTKLQANLDDQRRAMEKEEADFYAAAGVHRDAYFEQTLVLLDKQVKLWVDQGKTEVQIEALKFGKLKDLWDQFYKERWALRKYQEVTGFMPQELYDIEIKNIKRLGAELNKAGLSIAQVKEVMDKLTMKKTIEFFESQQDLVHGFSAGLMRLKDEIEPWGKIMSDAVVNAAHDMYNAMDDFFFEALEGRMKSFEEYFTGFMSNINRITASYLQENVKRGFAAIIPQAGVEAKGQVITGAGDIGSQIANYQNPARTPESWKGIPYALPETDGTSWGKYAGGGVMAAGALYSIYQNSQGQSPGKAAGMGAMSGLVAGAGIGAMLGGPTGIGNAIGAAIGAAAGAAIGGISGYLMGEQQDKAKMELATGPGVSRGYPSTMTPFGRFGFETAENVTNTGQFKATMETVKETTYAIAEMMTDEQVSAIKGYFEKGWDSKRIKGDMDPKEIEELFVSYFQEIGSRWSTEFGGWIETFDGTLDELTIGIKQHVEAVKFTQDILNPQKMTEYDAAVEGFNKQVDDMNAILEETGGTTQELTDLEAARVKGLEALKVVYVDQFDMLKMQLGGMTEQNARLTLWAKKFDTDVPSVIDNWDEIKKTIMDMDFTDFNQMVQNADMSLADFISMIMDFNVAAEEAGDQLRIYNSQIYAFKAGLPGLTTGQSNQFTLQYLTAKYGLTPGTLTAGFTSQAYQNVLASNMTTTELEAKLPKGVSASEFFQDLGTLHEIFFPEMKDATSNASDALNDLADEAQRLADAWKNVIESIQQDLDRMYFTLDNPQDVLERMQLVRQSIAGLGEIDTPEKAMQAREYWNQLLELGQEAWQRPTKEYQDLFDEVAGALKAIKVTAEDEQLKLLRMIEENTRNTANNVVLTSTVNTSVMQSGFESWLERVSAIMQQRSGTTPTGSTSTVVTENAVGQALKDYYNSGSYTSGTLLSDDTIGSLLAPFLSSIIIPHYQEGGVALAPTLASVAEGGPEAIIPLRNGAVPVEMVNGGDTVVHITVQVTGNANPEEARRQARAGVLEALNTPEARAMIRRNQRWGT